MIMEDNGRCSGRAATVEEGFSMQHQWNRLWKAAAATTMFVIMREEEEDEACCSSKIEDERKLKLPVWD